MFVFIIEQRCTTYLKARATNKSGTRVEVDKGGMGVLLPVGSRDKTLATLYSAPLIHSTK